MSLRLRHILLLCLAIPHLLCGQTPITLSDTNFRNCLSNKYPAALNSSKQLVPSQAASIKTDLTCSGMNITNVEGLQYFTGVYAIDLKSNKISYLPDLSAIKNLAYLDVSTNQLLTLPDLTQLKKLRSLVVFRNQLKVFPNLSQNDSLNDVNIHTNLLDTVPDISNLKKLKSLNLTANKLKHLPPSISGLFALETLIVWANAIEDLPPLAKLTNLVRLDASTNQLKALPSLPSPNKINKFLVDRNQLTTWPDNLKLDSLTSGNVYNNHLSFRELLKIQAPLPPTIFPQLPFTVGKTWTITEGGPLLLSTTIDQGVPNVSYEWYKNGVKFATVANDSLIIASTTYQDSGKYTCQIKHPSFPNGYLSTDTFYVSVVPCLAVPPLSISSTEINCTKTGSLTIKAGNNSSYTYLLKANASGRVYTSTTGIFTGLSEPRYSLALQAGNCTKPYPKEIVLQVQECKDFVVTPDNDGNMDSFYFNASGVARIFDKRGVMVREMKIPGEWDCRNENGIVPIGYYIAYINEGESQIGLSVMY